MSDVAPKCPRKSLLLIGLMALGIVLLSALILLAGWLAGYALALGDMSQAGAMKAANGFFGSASPPIWIILFFNVASFIGAIVRAGHLDAR